MKKILYLILALALCVPVYAQRGHSGNTRSSSPTRSSVSTSRPSSSRGSTATYRSSTPSRSTVSTRPSSPTRSSVSTSRPTQSNSYRTTPSTRNEYRGTVSTGRPTSSHGTPAHHPSGRPHGGPAVTNHTPHHPGPAHHHTMYHNGRHYRPHHMFYHPVYHRHVFMRPVYWDPWVWAAPVYWYGWWHYCYTYPTHDIVVVRQYVQETYHKEIISYVVYGEYVYSIVKEDGDTYLEIFANNDELVFKHQINKKYTTLVVDAESDGVWCLKKNNKDPLFIGHDDNFYIYEMD